MNTSKYVLTGLLLALSHPASSDLRSLNEALDAVLLGVRSGVRASGMSTLRVPDFRQDFTYRFLVRIGCWIRCRGGRVGDLSELARDGDLSVTEVRLGPEEKTVALDVRVRIERLQVYYPECQVEIKGLLKQTKPATVEISDRTLRGRLLLTSAGNSTDCLAELEDLRLDEATAVSIDSAGIVSKAKDRLIGIMRDHYNCDARAIVTDYLAGFLRQYLSQSSICQKI